MHDFVIKRKVFFPFLTRICFIIFGLMLVSCSKDALNLDDEVVKSEGDFGFQQIGNTVAGYQGMAIFGDYLVRTANGGTHKIYRIEDNGFSLIGSFALNGLGHANSVQFAPVLEPGQFLPYLYVSAFNSKCKVVEIDNLTSAHVVQTITYDIAGLPADSNFQIGDDGYLWLTTLDSASNAYVFIKFRKVSVSEGDVTLTSQDVMDKWESSEKFPYNPYVWQGEIIKKGKVYFLYGQTGNRKRGINIFDTQTHSLLFQVDFTNLSGLEMEDIDFYNNSIIVATYQDVMYKVEL